MSLESFRAVRWIRTLNLVLQAVLFLTFFAGLNYVARNHAWRFDLTAHHNFSLSPETLSYVKNLPRPVQIVVTTTEETENPELHGLLDEYVHSTETNSAGKITVEYLDVYQNRRRAEELGVEQPNIVLLRSGEDRRAVTLDELYRVKSVNGAPERVAFQGEQMLTDALLNVSNPDRTRVYFLVGHGELRPDDSDPARGLSVLRDQLRVRNFKVDTLELAVTRKVPPDASMLVITWPQTRYPPAEQEMLRQYLSVSAGRVIMFLAPGKAVSQLGLDDLLLDWGVLVYDDIVVDPGPEYRTDDGDLMIRFPDKTHPITASLVNNQLPLRFGLTRTVCPDPGRTLGSGLTVTTLVAASPQAWGEVGYRLGQPPRFENPGNTHPLPGLEPAHQLGVAVASERVSVRDNLPFSVRGGRLVVFGTGDLASNQRIGSSGNIHVVLGAVNWAADRDRQLSVPARPIERFQLALSASDFMRLRYALLLGLPGATLLLGLLVYWTRRT